MIPESGISGLPPGAVVSPIQGLPPGAVVSPIQGLPPGASVTPLSTPTQQSAPTSTTQPPEGTYQMMGPNGQSKAIPYSQVQSTAAQGYSFPSRDEHARYAKDYAADPVNENQVDKYMQSLPWWDPSSYGWNALLGLGKGMAKTVSGVDRMARSVTGTQQSPAETAVEQAGLDPTRGGAQAVGEAGENIGEYMSGEELLNLLGKTGMAMSAADRLKNATQIAQIAQKFPLVGKLLKIGATAVKSATIGGTQTLAKTGGDTGAATASGLETGALTAGLGAAGAIARRGIDAIAPTTENIAGVENPVPAGTRNIKPTPAQAAGQQSIKNTAQDALARNLQEVNESRAVAPGEASQPAAPAAPYEFNLKGPSGQYDTSEIGSRVVGSAAPGAGLKALPGKTGQDFSIQGTPTREIREGESLVPARPLPRENITGKVIDPGSGQQIPARLSGRNAFMTSPDLDTAPERGSTGADISTGRPIDIAGGGTLNSQDETLLQSHLDNLNRAIENPEFRTYSSAKQADILGARAQAEQNLEEIQNQKLAGAKTPPNPNQYDYRAAEARPAVNPGSGGAGTLKTTDYAVAQGHLHNLNQIIDGEDFADLPKAQQDELIEARQDTIRQMGQHRQQLLANYGGTQKGNFPQIDIPSTAAKAGSWTEAGNILEKTSTDGYEHFNDLTDGKFNAVREANKQAWRAYVGAAGTQAQHDAGIALDKTNQDMQNLMDQIHGAVTPKELDGFNDAFKSAQTLHAIGAAVDGSFTGNLSSTDRALNYVGFNGNKLMANLNRITNKLGPQAVRRVVGSDNLDNLYKVAELNRTPASRQQFGAAVSNIAQYMKDKNMVPLGILAATAGGSLGHMTGIGGYESAFAGESIYLASMKVLHAIETNSKIGQQLTYAVEYGANPKNYAPMIATAISQLNSQPNEDTK